MKLAWLRLRRRRLARRVGESTLQAFLQAPLPAGNRRLSELDLLALDFETTGLKPDLDRVVSAGWLSISAGAIRMTTARSLNLRPQRELGASAGVHGLRDIDLVHGDDEPGLLAAMLPALTGRILLAHGASIEHSFLDRMLRRYHGIPLLAPAVCTLSLEARLRQRLGETLEHGQLTLAACRRRYDLPAAHEHEALSDALACAELFLAQLAQFGGASSVRLASVLA